MASEAHFLLRLKARDAEYLVGLLAESASTAASAAIGDLGTGPRFSGRYRVGAAALDELRSVVKAAPPTSQRKRVSARLGQALIVQASDGGKLPEDRQGQLTSRPDAGGERKRVRHVTGNPPKDF